MQIFVTNLSAVIPENIHKFFLHNIFFVVLAQN